jgi:rhamnulokinase
MGVVTDQPVISDKTLALNFTNEGGVGGTTRLLKNITGMWILEQCRKQWAEQGKDYDHAELVRMAESVSVVPPLFNPDEPRFANPASMLDEVKGGLEMSDAEVVSCIFHSLAHRYGEVFGMLQQLLSEPIGCLYIIGGGARNALLARLTEQAVGVPVIIGATEATALGNILIQKQYE